MGWYEQAMAAGVSDVAVGLRKTAAAMSGRIVHSGTLTVLPGNSLHERLQTGRFDWSPDRPITACLRSDQVNSFSRNYAVTEEQFGEWDYAVYNFKHHIPASYAESRMQQDGWAAAASGHCFAYAGDVKALPCTAVIALSMSAPQALVIDSGFKPGKRGLILMDRGGDCDAWPPEMGFLGIRPRNISLN